MDNKISFLISSIVTCITIAVLGFSYSWLENNIVGNSDSSSMAITFVNSTLSYTDIELVNYDNILPGFTASKTFSVTNSGTKEVTYDLLWDFLTNTFITNDYRYTITSTNNGGSFTRKVIPSSGNNIKILNNISIAPNTTQEYVITFTYETSSEDQSSNMGKEMYGKLKIDGHTLWTEDCASNPNAFNCKILANATKINRVNSDSMFASTSTTNDGLWVEDRIGKTEENESVYFFRGNVNNNYVKFGKNTSNEDLYWRIVRIDETGSVRLIYAGTSANDTNGYVSAQGEQNTYSSTDLGNGTAWYATNFGSNVYTDSGTTGNSFDSYVNYRAKYCVDSSHTGTTDLIYGGNTRLSTNPSPSYKCPNDNDNYSAYTEVEPGQVSLAPFYYPVGVLSADEYVYAGGKYQTSNSSIYLNQNISIPWWTTTKFSLVSSVGSSFYVLADGSLDSANNTNTYANRPVIALKSCVSWTSGTGLSASPYTLSITNNCLSQ